MKPDDDPVVSLASVEGFAARLGQRARLIVDDDSGVAIISRAAIGS